MLMSRRWAAGWMFIRNHLDDLLALAGLVCLLSGIYLWLGLAAMLILLGLILIYTAARLDMRQYEPDQTTHPNRT